jgi:hypothetical protein
MGCAERRRQTSRSARAEAIAGRSHYERVLNGPDADRRGATRSPGFDEALYPVYDLFLSVLQIFERRILHELHRF